MNPSLLPPPPTLQEMKELGQKSNMAAEEASKWMQRLPVELGFRSQFSIYLEDTTLSAIAKVITDLDFT